MNSFVSSVKKSFHLRREREREREEPLQYTDELGKKKRMTDATTISDVSVF